MANETLKGLKVAILIEDGLWLCCRFHRGENDWMFNNQRRRLGVAGPLGACTFRVLAGRWNLALLRSPDFASL
jgi:hypothetical protein